MACKLVLWRGFKILGNRLLLNSFGVLNIYQPSGNLVKEWLDHNKNGNKDLVLKSYT